MAKIVTVYTRSRRNFEPVDMSYIRWLKISEALARCGHQVDIATYEAMWLLRKSPLDMNENLRRVPLSKIRWKDYDVVKTLFHMGFDTLEAFGGNDHPFIISKLGSVVASKDMDGIYFYGDKRKKLYATQERINRISKYVTVLSRPAKELWRECFDRPNNILIVQGGVDRDIPARSKDPYPAENYKRCLFAGNVYARNSQPEANRVLVDKLNQLGKLLLNQDVKLYMLGSGDVRELNKKYVTHLGVATYERSWDFFHFADVGVVVSAGKFNHNNESSKIYHYLRAGLPVVSEAGFPNDNVITESQLGFIVESNQLESLAKKITEASQHEWDRDSAVQYILDHHTWDKRVEVYDKVLKENFS